MMSVTGGPCPGPSRPVLSEATQNNEHKRSKARDGTRFAFIIE